MTEMTQQASTVADNAVEIAVPLLAEHSATLRIIVSSLGADRGLNVDQIDDMKLAVSEVFTLLIDDADEVGATRARVRYMADATQLRVELDRGLTDDTIELDALASTILASVVDEHVVTPAGVTLVKLIADAG